MFSPKEAAAAEEANALRREYNGEVRQRLSVQSIQPMDFVKGSHRLLDQLTKLSL